MSGERAFNGDSEPFDGSEGNTWEKGESGNPDGSDPKHGLYQDPDTFFSERPDAVEKRDELIETLSEKCTDPDLYEMEIQEYAQLRVRLKFARRNLGDLSNETWNTYRSMSTDARQILKAIPFAVDAGESNPDTIDPEKILNLSDSNE